MTRTERDPHEDHRYTHCPRCFNGLAQAIEECCVADVAFDHPALDWASPAKLDTKLCCLLAPP